ncbi:MAG: 5-(carboxyamino)imidazole ribonucleotide synthase [Alphaproteobacteria bacterium]|nr:5-(carboxyamino)imidazole ribonucleotide synthase [Alphaproteobacteria bacterium]MBV9372567.1 5-(carboxyamino)imidazole ribonucleotide synthase [Alphaproteobacteria bacterium]MBV9900896.1 5-(carboxyamino)imidazole ribonucleotide synthase [Alphaproteobacteria bacterium]
MTLVPPGSTIGIVGGGQLGRMLGMAAAQLGYRIHVFAPASGPANDVASAFTEASYHQSDRLAAFAGACDVVTYEFENVPLGPLALIAGEVPVLPGLKALEIAQVRYAEKGFVRDLGGRTAPFEMANDVEELVPALERVGLPAIVKTVRLGYDGKGQARVDDMGQARQAWHAVGRQPSIVEGFVDFSHEFSILIARGQGGATVAYPPTWNVHRGGILHRAAVPAPASIAAQAAEAAALAERVAAALDYVGVLALEFFATAEGPVFNEMAPRVHNSGHWTIEGAETSQFENHIRAICGLPLGSTALTGRRVEMENLIGDEAAGWPRILAERGAHLHLYGKDEASPGRKMGHVTRIFAA